MRRSRPVQGDLRLGPRPGLPGDLEDRQRHRNHPGARSESATGSLYLAKPYENPFGSLLALYMVLEIPDRGVLVKLPGRCMPDPDTGQLVTTFDDIPQLPVATLTCTSAKAPARR